MDKKKKKKINDYPNLLSTEIKKLLESNELEIEYVSPLKKDDYVEYRDNAFLQELRLPELIEKLPLFWPKKGPQWDGLGLSFDGKRFLIEAKANLKELNSPRCKADSTKSILKIDQSLLETKRAMSSDIPLNADWKGTYYQYTNRLAHLHFLRNNNIDAYLIFIYFVGDSTVKGPTNRSEWIDAVKKLKNSLSIPATHNYSDYILEIFIDVRDSGLS